MRSDAAIEPAAVEETLGVEHFLDLFHHCKIIFHFRPEFARFAIALRRKFNDACSHGWELNGGGIFEISVADARSRASHSLSWQGLQHSADLSQPARHPHHHSILILAQKLR